MSRNSSSSVRTPSCPTPRWSRPCTSSWGKTTRASLWTQPQDGSQRPMDVGTTKAMATPRRRSTTWTSPTWMTMPTSSTRTRTTRTSGQRTQRSPMMRTPTTPRTMRTPSSLTSPTARTRPWKRHTPHTSMPVGTSPNSKRLVATSLWLHWQMEVVRLWQLDHKLHVHRRGRDLVRARGR